MIWLGRYGFLTALGKAFGHDCRPSASRRADHHDLWLFCRQSKKPYRPLKSCYCYIVAVSFRFLTRVEWPCGNPYLVFYLQICDRYYNTDFIDICLQPVKWHCWILYIIHSIILSIIKNTYVPGQSKFFYFPWIYYACFNSFKEIE